MARFLFATQPITGHVVPALGIARRLRERGHEIRWYAGEKYRSQVEESGAAFEGYSQAYDYNDADYNEAFPGRGDYQGLDQIRFDFIHLFIKQAAPQHRDISSILARWPADVVLGDPSMLAPFTVNEHGGPPNAVYNITCLGITGRGIAPFGLGLTPTSSPLGRLRNRMLEFLAPNVIFRAVSREMAAQCAQIDARPRKFTGVLVSPYLFIQPTAEGFEYPRPDLPPQVHFVGALLPDPPTPLTPPAWWDEVAHKQTPVVLATQGTVATAARELIGPTLQGLADADLLVIAAGVADGARLDLRPLPSNARVERFVPFKPLMPLVDVFVTNGGFGGVQYALSSGVPIVAAGKTEDKAEVGNRIAYTGAGINLKTSSPSPTHVAEAVARILRDTTYRENAQRLQRELAGHDAPNEAAALLERLAGTQQPVLRN